MDEVDVYLERLFADGLKREIESDESVWRTLPFFATAIGITSTVLVYDAGQLPSFAWRLLTLASYFTFIAACCSVVAYFTWVFVAVWPREYRYPPSETYMKTLALDYGEYHSASGITGSQLDAAVVRSLRAVMVDEYAKSADRNRGHNRRRLFARSQATLYLMIGSAISIGLAAYTFAAYRIASAEPVGSGEHRMSTQDPISKEPRSAAPKPPTRPSPQMVWEGARLFATSPKKPSKL